MKPNDGHLVLKHVADCKQDNVIQ